MSKTVTLGSVCGLVNGKAFKPSDWSTVGVPIVRIQNLNGSDSPFNHFAGGLANQVPINSGDLLLAWSGTPGTSFGAHIWQGGDAILNQHIFRCDIDTTAVTAAWAKFVINMQLNQLIGLAHGGVGLKHVTRGMVESLKIPLPSLAEQRRIAEILDRAEALRAKRNATLAARRALTESLLSRLLGEAERRQWPVKCLADVCEKIFDADHKMPVEVPDGLPFISARDLTDDGISFANAKRISVDDFRNLARKGQPRRGDIVFSRYGTIGKTCMVDRDVEFLASYSCCTIRPNQAVAHPLFLSSYLGSPRVLRQAVRETRGIAIPDLGLKQIKEFSIIVPPIDAQVTFANMLQQLAACFSAMSHSLILLGSMITCLQSKAFRGEL